MGTLPPAPTMRGMNTAGSFFLTPAVCVMVRRVVPRGPDEDCAHWKEEGRDRKDKFRSNTHTPTPYLPEHQLSILGDPCPLHPPCTDVHHLRVREEGEGGRY